MTERKYTEAELRERERKAFESGFAEGFAVVSGTPICPDETWEKYEKTLEHVDENRLKQHQCEENRRDSMSTTTDAVYKRDMEALKRQVEEQIRAQQEPTFGDMIRKKLAEAEQPTPAPDKELPEALERHFGSKHSWANRVLYDWLKEHDRLLLVEVDRRIAKARK